jgi:hypothetical protein
MKSRQTERPTLESINIETFIFPIQTRGLHALFNGAALTFIWSDNLILFSLILELLSKLENNIAFNLVLGIQQMSTGIKTR